ncbi:cellulose binding domain-containing protein [Micromonospora thermarum]|uniref:Cellulose-binding protein n=1 Tax=Micromonospora thermarum TaxID=2720024 RepID=A0ABX0Z977_9ACTN|nr:cellulose binding domain-containing protein [Micromonospora thermarum]NJP32480.1 cellulose-binding protein [Micromonospora thermarum]
MSGSRRAPRSSRATAAIASSPWILVAAGVVVMVVLLVIALGAYRGRSGVDTPPDPPAPPLLLPEVPSSSATPTGPVRPGLSPRASVQPTTGVATPPHPAPRVTSRAANPTSPPPPAGMIGRYRVVNSFDGGFIGEVLVRNGTAERRGWTVRVTYAGGRFVTAWVESSEQGRATAIEGGFTYRSGVDVAPGGSATLRFHMERTDSRPTGCTVDGTPCVLG